MHNKEYHLVRLPSPSSSSSSFRDYYQHTSSNQELDNEQTYLIEGLRNFKIAKAISRMHKKIESNIFWNKFYALRKMFVKTTLAQKRKNAVGRFKNILFKMTNKQSALVVKSHYLHQFLIHSRQIKNRQIQKLHKFGLKYIRQNYIKMAMTYYLLRNDTRSANRKELPLPKEKVKYNKKLSRATLCIFIRNTIQIKLFHFFHKIKLFCLLNINKNTNTINFFKHKKERPTFSIKNSSKFIKLNKIVQVITVINAKMQYYYACFLKNITTQIFKSEQEQKLKDNPQIMANVAKHMIYLTGQLNQKAKIKNQLHFQQFRICKLKSLLRNLQRKQRTNAKSYLLYWRRITNDQHLELRSQIVKLEMIKKQYMDQFQ